MDGLLHIFNGLQLHHDGYGYGEVSICYAPCRNITNFRLKWQYHSFLTCWSQWGEFCNWKIQKYRRHLSIYLKNHYIVWKDYVVGLLPNNMTICRESKKIIILCDHPIFLISNFWQLCTNWFKPIHTDFINQ